MPSRVKGYPTLGTVPPCSAERPRVTVRVVNTIREAEGLSRRLRDLDAEMPVVSILQQSADIIGTVVPFDACAVTSTDPSSLLPAGAAYIRMFPAESCGPYWDKEYLEPDVMSIAGLHEGGGTPQTLHRVTAGRPDRSSRHREILSGLGLDAQLRSTISTTAGCYGLVDLVRGEGEPDFTDDELVVVDLVRPAMADLLRTALARPQVGVDGLPTSSAVVIIGEGGDILSMTPQAKELISLIPEAVNTSDSSAFLNAIVHAIWARARFLAGGFDAPEASTRVALLDGQRVTLRGTCTRTPDGRMGHTVLTIEPTRTSELGPLVVAAHELTTREEEIVSLLLRGDSAQQISSGLEISIHTVRTHIRSIHDKMGISSRAELTRLFIDEEFLPNVDLIATSGAH